MALLFALSSVRGFVLLVVRATSGLVEVPLHCNG